MATWLQFTQVLWFRTKNIFFVVLVQIWCFLYIIHWVFPTYLILCIFAKVFCLYFIYFLIMIHFLIIFTSHNFVSSSSFIRNASVLNGFSFAHASLGQFKFSCVCVISLLSVFFYLTFRSALVQGCFVTKGRNRQRLNGLKHFATAIQLLVMHKVAAGVVNKNSHIWEKYLFLYFVFKCHMYVDSYNVLMYFVLKLKKRAKWRIVEIVKEYPLC